MALPVEWMALTGDQLVQARTAAAGVCLIPIGVLERHSTHLPTGTDVYEADAVAKATAAREYAVVLPPMPYSVNDSSSNCPGAIDLPFRVLFDFYQGLFDEVARNGFNKIVLINFHGGNRSLLPALLSEHKCRPDAHYDLYLPDPAPWSAPDAVALCHAESDWHAGELETSLIQHLRPDLVDCAAFPAHATLPRPNYPLAGANTSLDWVASFPDHYAGNAPLASAEKGAKILEAIAIHLARVLQDIKADTLTPALREEFRRQRLSPAVLRRAEPQPSRAKPAQ